MNTHSLKTSDIIDYSMKSMVKRGILPLIQTTRHGLSGKSMLIYLHIILYPSFIISV
uniref:Uncharacterized protein n=1 Tax=Candidatus Methanogaster sp. ANME-2c ERB4 TaxID=2759911 RepID=A0A7G9Y0E3_9EURY|nr:hypothetical protein PPGKDJHO_00008 [Methanosarcinales archaeon ANME-2c ERB4]QNO48097.1 hypothetical protein DOJOGAGO_00005 [Methanosarcinales archaeon ANME-2c ERB4]